MNEADSVPSPSRLRSALGMRSAARNASAAGVFQQALHELQLFPHAGDRAGQVLDLRFEYLDFALYVTQLRGHPSPAIGAAFHASRHRLAEWRIDQNRGHRDQQRDDENYGEDPHESDSINPRPSAPPRQRFRPAARHRNAPETRRWSRRAPAAAPAA